MRYEPFFPDGDLPLSKLPGYFCIRLEQIFPGNEIIRFLAYAPEFVTAKSRWPASILALGNRGWYALWNLEDGASVSRYASYADTVLVERTSILLYGQVRIDFALDGKSESVTIDYNNMDSRRYQQAILLILTAMEGLEPKIGNPVSSPLIEALPLKFRNAAGERIPGDRKVLSAVAWPAVVSGFRRELAPAAALLRTDQELIVISDDRGPDSMLNADQSKYGTIVTYYPRSRVARASVVPHGRFNALTMEMHAHHGGETVEILLPLSTAPAVQSAIGDFPQQATTVPAVKTLAAEVPKEQVEVTHG